jgi:hypothetical protein
VNGERDVIGKENFPHLILPRFQLNLRVWVSIPLEPTATRDGGESSNHIQTDTGPLADRLHTQLSHYSSACFCLATIRAVVSDELAGMWKETENISSNSQLPASNTGRGVTHYIATFVVSVFCVFLPLSAQMSSYLSANMKY